MGNLGIDSISEYGLGTLGLADQAKQFGTRFSVAPSDTPVGRARLHAFWVAEDSPIVPIEVSDGSSGRSPQLSFVSLANPFSNHPLRYSTFADDIGMPLAQVPIFGVAWFLEP